MTITATLSVPSHSDASSPKTNAPASPPHVAKSLPTNVSSSSSHPNRAATQPRLLYRGALSCPDSHLPLEGLTFTIALPANDPNASRTLLESPLPLALESMRGRPSLRFSGIVKMEDISWEDGGRVTLHVHPRCILTRQLFARTLCTTPVSLSTGHTDSGIRISLGDASNANANNDIVVFGRPHSSSSVMQLCVARILLTPPKPSFPSKVPNDNAQQVRPPRPDDPTPRKPPAGFAGIARIGLGMKRTASMKAKDIEKERGEEGEEQQNKRTKKDKDPMTRGGQGSFKVPPLPPGMAPPAIDVDVFDAPMEAKGGSQRTSDLETQNKTFIKKAVVRLMSATGISKTNSSFKDFFNQVYHGTSFALRSKLGTSNFDADTKDAELVDRVAQAHITLYLGGLGVGVLLLQQQ